MRVNSCKYLLSILLTFAYILNVHSQSTFPPQERGSYDVGEITVEMIKIESLNTINDIVEKFNVLSSDYYMWGKKHTEMLPHRMIYLKNPYSIRVKSLNPLSIGGKIETLTFYYNSEESPIIRVGINIVCSEKEDRNKLAKNFINLFEAMGYNFSEYDKENRRYIGKTNDMQNGVVIITPNGFDGHYELYVSIGEYSPYMMQE